MTTRTIDGVETVVDLSDDEVKEMTGFSVIPNGQSSISKEDDVKILCTQEVAEQISDRFDAIEAAAL